MLVQEKVKASKDVVNLVDAVVTFWVSMDSIPDALLDAVQAGISGVVGNATEAVTLRMKELLDVQAALTDSISNSVANALQFDLESGIQAGIDEALNKSLQLVADTAMKAEAVVQRALCILQTKVYSELEKLVNLFNAAVTQGPINALLGALTEIFTSMLDAALGVVTQAAESVATSVVSFSNAKMAELRK